MRASAVSSPIRPTSTTSPPDPFIVPPTTSPPSTLSTGIASPVTIDSIHRGPSSRTAPSTGTRSPGRTRTRSPTRSAETSTISSTPSRIRSARSERAHQRAHRRACAVALARFHPAPHEDERDDDRGRIEVDAGSRAARGEETGKHGGDHAVGVGGGGPHRDQRVHVGGAVTQAPQRGAMEGEAGPQVDRRS